MTDFLGYPGLQAVWDLRRHHFHSAFRSMVDDTIATVRTGGPIPHLYGESIDSGNGLANHASATTGPALST